MNWAVWLILIVAVVAANWPLMWPRRVLGLWPLRRDKPGYSYALEWLLMYLFTGVVARLIEAQWGSVYPQRWEFYAVTLALFAIFAFPGFVWRFLRRQ